MQSKEPKKGGSRPYEEAERAFENGIATRYNRDYHEPLLMQWHAECFVEFVKQFHHKGDRVLDLGCGPASLWPFWQKHFDGLDNLVGIDLSPGMVNEASRLFPSGEFRVGSFFNIPAEAGSFDLVIVSSAFHHIPDENLPEALSEIHRVLDEHGVLVGREPLANGRIGDRGGWLGGALMNLRHLAYRLTHTREYPEPDPGPAHHAYDAEVFLDLIAKVFDPMQVNFRNPVSLFLARVRHPVVAKIGQILDEAINHREGQEILYAARKNFASAKDVENCVQLALKENKVEDMTKFLVLVAASAQYIEQRLNKELSSRRSDSESGI